jgi:hypothetical protein
LEYDKIAHSIIGSWLLALIDKRLENISKVGMLSLFLGWSPTAKRPVDVVSEKRELKGAPDADVSIRHLGFTTLKSLQHQCKGQRYPFLAAFGRMPLVSWGSEFRVPLELLMETFL